eukprot:6486842-Pyramimonas_sp.AAC.1
MPSSFDPLYRRTMLLHRSVDLYADGTAIAIVSALRGIASASCKVLRLRHVAHVIEELGLPPASHKMKAAPSPPQ